MEGLERLQTEVLELNNYNISAIFDYLKTRNDLHEKFNNEEKSINQMYKYICDKAKKLAINNVAMVNDRVVYLWAITYFNKSNAELGISKIIPTDLKYTETKHESKKSEKNKLIENDQEDSQISLFQEVQK